MVAAQRAPGRAARRRRGAHRRDGGDPRGRQPRRVRRRRARRAAASRSTILDGEEEARLAFLGATRTLGRRSTGTVGVVDVGGGSTEIAVGTRREGVDVVGVVPRSARACWPTATGTRTRRRPPSCRRCARTPRACSRASTCRAATPRWRSAAAPPRCGGWSGAVLDAGDAAARAARAVGRPAAEVARRFALDRERVRLMPAGLLILDAAVARARLPAADRPRRAARGRPARARGGGSDRAGTASTDAEHRRPRRGAPRPDLDDRELYFNRELSWLQFNERVLELAEDPRRPAARAPEVLRDLLDQPRRVLHGPRRRPARPDRRRHRDAAAGRAHAERDDRARSAAIVREHIGAPGALPGATTCARRSPSTASASSASTRSPTQERERSTSASGARSSPC